MEEQIITVHIPKDQYRKFAQIAWQVNVPMQTILSQFVADFTSDRWGTAEGTMAKDWFGNHWWSNFEREDFLGWLAQSNQLMEAGKIGISIANELAGMKPEEQQMVAKQIDAGEKITLQPKKKTVKTTEKQDAVESRSVSESDTTQCKQSESRKIVRTEQHEEEQLPGQISVDDYVSEGFELRDTNEEIDVAVSVDDVAKKESSTTTENDLMQSLAHDYLALYERGDDSETEWQAMHRQLAEYFANLIR